MEDGRGEVKTHKAFNRTIVELKSLIHGQTLLINLPFNRTIVELKFNKYQHELGSGNF